MHVARCDSVPLVWCLGRERFASQTTVLGASAYSHMTTKGVSTDHGTTRTRTRQNAHPMARHPSHVLLQRVSRPTLQRLSRPAVINEDYVAPGQGFGTHGHRDMEIISYVVEASWRIRQHGRELDYSPR